MADFYKITVFSLLLIPATGSVYALIKNTV